LAFPTPGNPHSGSNEGGGASKGIELRHLRYFVAVSEELHFGKAAKRLHIAQPPLSQAIRKLEDHLGLQLLHRTSRVVAPTDAGRVFLEEARKVLAAFEFAVTEAQRTSEEQAGLRVGCVPNLPIERLLRFLRALREISTDSAPHIAHLVSGEQVKRLYSGDLDLGIVHYAENYEDLELAPLFDGEPLAALLPPGHPLAQADPLTPEQLAEESLVIFPREGNPALHDGMLALIKQAGYNVANIREAGGMDARDLLISVASGLGVGIGPHSIKEVSEAGSLVVRRSLDPPVAMPETVLVWRKNAPRRLQLLLPEIRELATKVRAGSSQT
jgi:DNA-binding transcriptional LysR family regulator